MTEARSKTIHELIVKVLGKKKRKPSLETIQKAQETGKKLDEYFYQLEITCENKPKANKVYVFKDNLESEKVWKDIESSEYIDKRYLFYCQMGMYGSYRLVNWKQLKNNKNGND